MGNKRLLFLDADIIVFRAGFACEKRIVETDDEGYTIKRIEVASEDDAREAVDSIIHDIVFEVDPTEYTLYLSGDNNFRKNIATIREYKGNRNKARPPVHFDMIRQYMQDKYKTEIIQDQEADDQLGIELTKTQNYATLGTNEETDVGIVASVDKDLLMIPGNHYNFVKRKFAYIDEDMARRIFWTQMLVGDTTDNILGCPGIGPKKAAKILRGVTQEVRYWRHVRRAYKEQFERLQERGKMPTGFRFDGEVITYPSWRTGADMQKSLDEYLTEIGRLLWIRRKPMQLWEPPIVGEDV